MGKKYISPEALFIRVVTDEIILLSDEEAFVDGSDSDFWS